MLVKMNMAEAGGGNIKTGSGTFTTVSTESAPIQTGLANISRFILVLKPTGWSSTLCACLYDADVSDTKYTALSTNDNATSGAWAYNGVFGTAGNERLAKIKSINNGEVTLISPSNSNFLGDYYWYAE